MSTTISQGFRGPARLRAAAGVAVLAASLALTACTGSPAPPAPSEPSAAATASTNSSPNATASPNVNAPTPDAAGGLPQLVENLAPSVVTIFTEGGLGSGVVYS